MKKQIIIISAIASLFLVGCLIFLIKKPAKDAKNINKPTPSLAMQINQSLERGSAVAEIKDPGLALPSDIKSVQIQKYFKMDNILFALVLRNSMNVVLSLPDGFIPSYAGVLVADQNETKWTKFAKIQDVDETNKNNPYFLLVNNKKLLLTVVDQAGAGSGEGMMKVFALSETSDWKLESCYYFGEGYSDPSTDGDYFAFSAKFSEQTSRPIESCNNVELISEMTRPKTNQ